MIAEIVELLEKTKALKEKLSLLETVPEELEKDLQELVYEMSALECLLLERIDINIPNL